MAWINTTKMATTKTEAIYLFFICVTSYMYAAPFKDLMTHTAMLSIPFLEEKH